MKQILTTPKFITITLAVLALFIIPLTLIEVQSQQTIQQHAASTSCSGFNGDDNAVIWCGADDSGTAKPSEIRTRYENGDGHNSAKSIQDIYGSSYYGITDSDIKTMSSDEKIGTVTKSGEVILNGTVVATNAETAGRQNISGSTKHTVNGTVFYNRPPSVSFEENSLSAYIVMANGKFKYAILISCGNPVSATPKTAPKPTPTPTPKPKSTPTPTPTPKPINIPTPTPTTPPGQPTPTICPTLKPVSNVHIVCPNCQLKQQS